MMLTVYLGYLVCINLLHFAQRFFGTAEWRKETVHSWPWDRALWRAYSLWEFHWCGTLFLAILLWVTTLGKLFTQCVPLSPSSIYVLVPVVGSDILWLGGITNLSSLSIYRLKAWVREMSTCTYTPHVARHSLPLLQMASASRHAWPTCCTLHWIWLCTAVYSRPSYTCQHCMRDINRSLPLSRVRSFVHVYIAFVIYATCQ